MFDGAVRCESSTFILGKRSTVEQTIATWTEDVADLGHEDWDLNLGGNIRTQLWSLQIRDAACADVVFLPMAKAGVEREAALCSGLHSGWVYWNV